MNLHLEYPGGMYGAFHPWGRWSSRYVWLRLTGPGRVAVQSHFEPFEDPGIRHPRQRTDDDDAAVVSIQNTQKIKQYEAKNRIMKHRSNRMTYRGRMKNGVIVLESPASLPEGSEVEVNPLQEDQNIPTLHERA